MNGTAKKPQRGWRHESRACRRALLCIAAVAALSLSMVDRGLAGNPWAKSRNARSSSPNAWGASPNAWGNSKTPWANSQNSWGRSPSPKSDNKTGDKTGDGTPSNFSGYMTVPSEGIAPLPSMEPRLGQYTGAIPDGLQAPQRPAKRTAGNRAKDAPTTNERDEFARNRDPQGFSK